MPTEISSAEASADRTIVSTRDIDFPRALVWKAWIEPDHLQRWWGPDGFTNTFHDFDPRPDGFWRFTMHAPDGTDFPNESVFREIDPPQRLVFDHLSDHPFRVVATFDETGSGGTRVTFRMVHESAEDCERVRALVTKANEQNFDRLEAELRRMAAKG